VLSDYADELPTQSRDHEHKAPPASAAQESARDEDEEPSMRVPADEHQVVDESAITGEERVDAEGSAEVQLGSGEIELVEGSMETTGSGKRNVRKVRRDTPEDPDPDDPDIL
jgi:hypothetical protein